MRHKAGAEATAPSASNTTHPPPFISVRSASTSSAPSIATSSCVGAKEKSLQRTRLRS